MKSLKLVMFILIWVKRTQEHTIRVILLKKYRIIFFLNIITKTESRKEIVELYGKKGLYQIIWGFKMKPQDEEDYGEDDE